MVIVPRPYQSLAIKAALIALRSSVMRALVVMATGLGKTLTAALITQELAPKRVLVLAQSNFILDHARKEFDKVFGKTKMKVAFYNGMFKNGAAEANIVFATWQTMSGHLQEWSRDHFDLVIVDEAHHEGAETYRPVAEYFTGAKLGITATYERNDDVDICDTFGQPVINITLEEAIARGWLPRIEYHVVTDKSLDEKALQKIVGEIRQGKKRFTMAEVDRRLFIKKREEDIAKIIEGYKEKAIVFCRDIDHAERMSKDLRLSATFHSKKGKGSKKSLKLNLAVLADLEQGLIGRVCAVNAFNEGVDVPSVELVAFCRVTNSWTVFRQQLGRGLRPGKNKLIVLDFVGNLERIRLIQDMMNKVADLHEEYTSQADIQREGYTRQPFEVSGAGFEFTFSEQIIDLMTVLKHCEEDLYPRWQEASQAAIGLGITTCAEYVRLYRQDFRLPASPDEKYPDFPGWGVFLKTGRTRRRRSEIYPTWQEAGEVVRRLGIKDGKEYKKRYKEDPRLPSVPYIYPDFPGFEAFFDCRYATWQQASEVAIKLRVASRRDYRKKCEGDPKLPLDPACWYSDFPGWPRFLRKKAQEKRSAEQIYPTWQEAAEAAIRLGMKSKTEYSKSYKGDPRLPSNPHLYKEFPGWIAFFKKKVRCKPYATWQEASAAAQQLGIKTKEEYKKRYTEDPLLQSDPERSLENFPGFPLFLGREIRGEVYATWPEASQATIKLGITTQAQYRQRYKEDPALPSNPWRYYPDFPNWGVFLGKKKIVEP